MRREEHANQQGKGGRILRSLVQRHKLRMALLAITSFTGALMEAGFLVLLTGTVLSLTNGSDTVGPLLGQSVPLNTALILGATLVVVRLVLSLAGVKVSASLTAQVTAHQRRRLSNAYLKTSWAIQQSEPSGRLQELLTAFVGQANSAMAATTQAVTTSLSLVAFLSAGLLINASATLAVLAALALLGSVLTPIRRRIRKAAEVSAASNLEFAKAVAELGTLGQEMQTYGVQDRFAEHINHLTQRTIRNSRRVQVLQGSLAPMYTFMAYVAILCGIAALMIVGIENLAAVGAIMLLMLRSLSYGQQLLTVTGTVSGSLPYLERIATMLAHYEASPASSGTTIPEAAAPLKLTSVSYDYEHGRPALSGLDLTLSPGEMVGVIGPSGAGKSTLAQILLGLRTPTMGDVRAAGVDLTAIERSWWTKRVAFVAQDALLLTGTVAENLRFFREGLDEAALHTAALQSNILDDIMKLPQGFDTHLGERGSQLSGGQRQRLAIARALIGQPELLVLDEPTSALDGESETLIRDTLGRLRGNVTVVIIAHRMSTLDLCDRIMVIEDGRVTGLDAPNALQAQEGYYRNALVMAGIS